MTVTAINNDEYVNWRGIFFSTMYYDCERAMMMDLYNIAALVYIKIPSIRSRKEREKER